jgi:type I restriction enzyme S subunit
MTDAIDLTTEQRTTLNDLLRRFLPNVTVWAYGSRVKWTARRNSDLDLVAFTTPVQRPQVAELKDALAQSNLPFPVDLHVWDDVPKRFREIIRKEYVVMQEDKPLEKQDVVGRWNKMKLGDAIELKRGYDLPSHDRRDGPFPIVSSSGISGRHAEAKAKAPGVVIGRYGTLGEVHYVTEAYWPLNTALYVRDFKGNDPRFVSYFLRSLDFSAYSDKAAVPGLNRNDLHTAQVSLPPCDEQRAIANILGTLDDKIELNQKINDTLEAMARALFKSWFVDFDPVHAKAEGRDTGLPTHLADLFPDSFVDSELGEIPRGWEIKAFADTIEIVGGGTPKTSVAEYWDGDIPWFSVVDSPTDSDVWVVDTEKKVTRAGVENSSTRVLPEGTTIISARGTVGRIALVGVPMAMNQSCYGLRGRAEAHGFFTYFSTRELVARLQQHAHGSVFDTITRDTLAGVSVVVPAATLIEEFEKRVAPILHRIRVGLLETRMLAALRDTLLPKLISGELRVKDAERFMERAV